MTKEETKLFIDEDNDDMDVSMPQISNINIDSTHESMYQESLNEQGLDDSDTDLELEEEDPIIESIPLFINSIGEEERESQSIHLLQYSSKPKSIPQTINHVGAAVKPESNFIKVKIPLDTNKFYDNSKTEEWGVAVNEHEHMGVLNKTNGGLYAAKYVIKDGEKQVHLIPIDSTAQLRPSFKYLDDIENLKMLQRKESFDQSAKPQSVHVLQSTAKNTKTSNNDPFVSTALGESLKHVRRFDQEEWSNVTWEDDENLEKFTESTTKLQTKTTMDDYINQLTH